MYFLNTLLSVIESTEKEERQRDREGETEKERGRVRKRGKEKDMLCILSVYHREFENRYAIMKTWTSPCLSLVRKEGVYLEVIDTPSAAPSAVLRWDPVSSCQWRWACMTSPRRTTAAVLTNWMIGHNFHKDYSVDKKNWTFDYFQYWILVDCKCSQHTNKNGSCGRSRMC